MKLSYGGEKQRDQTIFMGEVDPSRHHVKFFEGHNWRAIDNWRRARLDKMVKKWGRKKFIFHAIIPALYPLW